MPNIATMQEVLEASKGRISDEKLERLARTLEQATDTILSKIVVDDPMTIRRAMIRYLKACEVTPGNLQHLEQAFMGVIRRAAVVGLLPAPPEGPWTRQWQGALDFNYQGDGFSKARMRSLAAWATDRDIQPSDVDDNELKDWASATGQSTEVVQTLGMLLVEFSQASTGLHRTPHLDERLRSKAKRGTVRT